MFWLMNVLIWFCLEKWPCPKQQDNGRSLQDFEASRGRGRSINQFLSRTSYSDWKQLVLWIFSEICAGVTGTPRLVPTTVGKLAGCLYVSSLSRFIHGYLTVVQISPSSGAMLGREAYFAWQIFSNIKKVSIKFWEEHLPNYCNRQQE